MNKESALLILRAQAVLLAAISYCIKKANSPEQFAQTVGIQSVILHVVISTFRQSYNCLYLIMVPKNCQEITLFIFASSIPQTVTIPEHILSMCVSHVPADIRFLQFP